MDLILRKHFGKLITLSDEEFNYILSHFVVRKFRKHQFLVQQGSPVLYDYFVAHGLVKASMTGQEGKEHILQFAMEDWWISDYQAYFNQTDAALDITCVEDVEVFCLSLANREKLCAELHLVEHFFRKKSNLGYIALQRRILSLMQNNAQARYSELLRLYPGLSKRIPKTMMASYLGVSRETLSRFSS